MDIIEKYQLTSKQFDALRRIEQIIHENNISVIDIDGSLCAYNNKDGFLNPVDSYETDGEGIPLRDIADHWCQVDSYSFDAVVTQKH